MASVQVKLEEHVKLAEIIGLVSQIVRRELSRMPLFCQELAHGRYAIVNKILLLYKALANKSTLR